MSAVVMGYAMYHAGEALPWLVGESPMHLPVCTSGAIELMGTSSLARRWWWLAPAMVVVTLFVGLAIGDL